MKEYNQIIRELREDKDMSQEELSKILNISQQTLSQYETKRRALPIELLRKYAKIFEVTTDYILGLTDKKEPNYKINNIKNQLNIAGQNKIHKIEMKWGKNNETFCLDRRIYKW